VVSRIRTFFSLFFIPVVPLGSSYRTTCTMCGRSVKITRETAEHIVDRAATGVGARDGSALPGTAPDVLAGPADTTTSPAGTPG
jgi:hypothetical protein